MRRGLIHFALLAGLAVLSAGLRAANDDKDKIFIPVRLELHSAAKVELDDIKNSIFPSGKRCSFNYSGCRDPKTIARLTQMGFRTSMAVGPDTSAETAKALEDAGAELTVGSMWGAKGSWLSTIGCNSHQEAFDAAACTRLALLGKVRGPVHCVDASSSKSGTDFMYRRYLEDQCGFGYVFQDCNYLVNAGWAQGYPTLLGRNRPSDPQVIVDLFNNGMDSKSVPNEIVYYRIVANWFRGTLQRTEKGQVVRFSLRDFKEEDFKQLEEIISEWGRHPEIWHATSGAVAGYAYISKKVRVQSVKAVGSNELQLMLAVDKDIYPRFLLAPLSLEFPKGFPLKSGSIGGTPCPITEQKESMHVDIPLQDALRDGCEMKLATAVQDMTIPAEMDVTLTIKNTSDKPLENAKLEWVGNVGLSVTGGGGESFTLAPKSERTVTAKARTQRGDRMGNKAFGARFGLNPVQAIVTGKCGSEEKTYMAGFEIVVAPRLRMEVFPAQLVPMYKGMMQHFVVYVSNIKQSKPGGPQDKFIFKAAGPCKGVVKFELPAGIECDPPEQSFNLAAESTQRMVFKVKNTVWGDELPAKAEAATPLKDGKRALKTRVLNNQWDNDLVVLKPVVKFEGEAEPVETIFPGVCILRDRALVEYKALNEQGLSFYGSWDDPDGKAGVDKSSLPGNTRFIYSAGEESLYNDGVKGWCLNHKMHCFIDPYKTVDYQQGAIAFWMRRDPIKKNENQIRPDPTKTWQYPFASGYGPGETITGGQDTSYIEASNSNIVLRRWPGWDGKDGYLEFVFSGIDNQRHYVQAPYKNEWLSQWHHIGLTWQLSERRLEIFIDGELAGKAEPGKDEWMGRPFDCGGSNRGTDGGFSVGSCDHGKITLTLRDEYYLYTRALTPAEIKANMELTKKK